MELLTWARNQWDRVGAGVAIGVGIVVLIVGYFGVSGTVYITEQLPYLISAGLTAVFLLGVGVMLWLSADLRDEWRKLDDVEAMLREIRDQQETGEAAAAGGQRRSARTTRTKPAAN